MSPIRPENRHRYPVEWPAIRATTMTRAGGRCECRGECGHDHAAEAAAIQRALAQEGIGAPVLPPPPERCAAENHQHHPITGSRVVLTIAHLDHTPENNAPANLGAMCQRCHLAYDREHHAATRAAGARAERERAGQLVLVDAGL